MSMTNMVWKVLRVAPVELAAWTTSSACSWVAEAGQEVVLLSREKLVLSHRLNKLTSP
jgi:hypothetical protein